MINGLILTSLRNRLAVLLISTVLLVTGAVFTLRMPVDVFPDLTAPTVSIVVEGHGMAPEEMETLVTFPIETAVNGATDVRRVRSATAVGLAIIWVEFEWGTDIYRARQTVTERLAPIAATLPQQVEPPALAPVSSIMGETMFLSLTSDRHGLMELRTTAESMIRRRILAVSGVSQVTVIGGDLKQYQVLLDAQRMKALEVTMNEVSDALSHGNQNVSAGFLDDGKTENVLRGIGRIQNVADISDTVVASRHGRAITVGDVGEVRLGAAIKRGTGAASRRGPNHEPITEDGVILSIAKQPSANTLELTGLLDATLEDIQHSLPEGMVINSRLFRQSDFIENSIRNTTAALLEGGLFVVVIVIAFLASMKASLITLLAIPISLVSAVLALHFTGASINTMTLGGMAIAIGALVDDAIIDVENVVRRLRLNRRLPKEERENVIKVIFDASVEVRTSIVFATFIILLVFTPLLFLSGVEGRLLRPLGVAFCVSLAASLLTALTLTPALCSYLLPESKTVRGEHEPRLIVWLKKLYRGPLDWVLRHPWLTTVPAVALLVVSLVAASRMGKEFLPEFNEGGYVIGLVTLPGTSLQQSSELTSLAQKTLMRHPEVIAMGRRTGRAERDEHAQGVEATELDMTIDMSAPERLGLAPRTQAEFVEAMRSDLALIPGLQATIGQPISHRIDHMLSGTRATIAVKIFGDELPTLRRVAAQVEEQMSGIAGVVDLSTEQQIDVPQVRVEFRREALARYGLHISEAADALTAAFRGNPVSQVLEGQQVYDVTVRLAESPNADEADVGEVLVDTPMGYKVPLKTLAHIYQDSGPNFINRENVQRKIVVMCNVAGRDMGSVVADIQRIVSDNVVMPPGYYVQYGGQFESAEATNQRLMLLGILVIVTIGFMLHIMFGSMRAALLIMVNLPLALIGGVAGVYFSGGVLSVASIIGFISVFGIAARNGIMLVSHIAHLQRYEGVHDFKEAVRRGSMERLAPILMTALAAGLALIPLAMKGEEPGTEILTPMAMVILFGLLSSTVLNMLVVPALFLRFGKPPKLAAPRSEEGFLKGAMPSTLGSWLALPTVGLLALMGAASCAQIDPQADFDQAGELLTQRSGVEQVYDPGHLRQDRDGATIDGLRAEEVSAYFRDGLSLEEALQLGLLNNRDLQADFQRIGIAHADWVQAGLWRNPSLDAMLRTPTGAGSDVLELALGLQLMDLWRVPLQQRLAEHEVQATVLRVARRGAELAADVEQAYWQAVVAEQELVAMEKAVKLEQQWVKAHQLYFDAGELTEVELQTQQAAWKQLELQWIEQADAVDLSRNQLATLLSVQRDLGRVPLTTQVSAVDWSAEAEPEAEALIRLALQQRLDLQSMQQSVLALEQVVELHKSGRWGDVGVGLSTERDDDNTLLGPAVNWVLPLFDQNQARIARAEFELAAMRKQFEQQQVLVAQQVRGLAQQIQNLGDAIAFQQTIVIPELQRAMNQQMIRVRAGEETKLAVMRIQRDIYSAERALNAKRLQLAALHAQLVQASGQVK